MRNTVNNYVEKFKQERRKRRRTYGLLFALALVVTGGIWWQLHSTGIAMTNETYCGLQEHTHDESCYEEVLICGLEETEGKSETSEGHTHDESCYVTESTLICGQEASEGHTHDESCYDEEGNLICGLETSEGHTHTGECYEDEKVLICELEDTEGVSETSEDHTHTEDCYELQLVCGKEEHKHTSECMTDQSADLETEEYWTSTLPDDLTNVWADDVVSIALSQVGYTESTKNFTLASDGETRQGYTRYGAWYGNAYGNWDVMFASFCLYYAGVDENVFPEASGAYAWMVELGKLDLYVDAADYTPVAGDLVFLDTNADSKADRVGIVAAVDEAGSDTATLISVIEGDCTVDGADVVAQNQYELSDGTIMGFGILPEQEETEQTAVSSGTLTYEGEDYTVTVTYDEDAEVPEDAKLIVSEYEADSEKWLERYEEAAALYTLIGTKDKTAGDKSKDADAPEEAAKNKSAANAEYDFRLFSIKICTGGKEIMPAAEVYVSITVDGNEENPYTVICFDKEGAAEAETESVIADSAQTVSFPAESLGDYALISNAAGTDDADQTPVTLTYQGGDYIVTVVYGADAELPEGTELAVSEYAADSETWQNRYTEAAELYGWDEGKTYDFRLFNIALIADGAEVEPAAEVQVTISFLEKEELTEYTVTHYGEEETETVDAVSEYAEDTQSVSFGTDGFSDFSLASENTTNYKVEYYAYLDVVETSKDSGTLAVLNTSAEANGGTASTPANSTTNPKLYIELEETSLESGQYKIATTTELTRIYTDETCTVEKYPDVASVNKLKDNSSYTLYQVWVSTDSGTNWTTYTYVDDMEFTNVESSADGINIIYIPDGAVVRLVYNTEEASENIGANLYDYDITDGNGDTYLSGINSSSNYTGSGAKLAFGNNNTSTGLASETLNGYYINRANAKTNVDYGCSFGIAVGLNSDGTIKYNSEIDAPALFNESNDGVAGKTTYSGQTLTFSQVGDTYTLSSVSGSSGIGVSGLQYFTHLTSYTSGVSGSFDIYTNSFWPMDGVTNGDGSHGDSLQYKNETDRYTSNGSTGDWPISDDSEDHNSYFGMQYSVNFKLTADYCGPLNYLFFGDDDMWVFLTDPNGDSRLICDIGGVHSSVGEYVDLWDYIDQGDTGTYTLTFFYTERGASGSSCYMQFTLPSVTSGTTVQNTGTLKVEKEVDSDEATGNETFNFTLSLKSSSGSALTNAYAYDIFNSDGSKASSNSIGNDGTFTLKDGQYIKVEYLPVGTQCTVTETTTGYTTYYTVDSDSLEEGTKESGNITSGLTEGTAWSGSITDGDTLTIKFVNSTPGVEKKVQDSNGNWVDESTASIDSTVQFKTTISDVSGVTNLVLHDKLDDGLANPNVSSVVVLDSKGNTKSVNESDYEVTYYVGVNATAGTSKTDDCSFEIEFEDDFLATLSDDDVIVVYYRATLTEDAEIGTEEGNENTTRISYGASAYSEWDTTTTYTFQIDILKYSGDEELSGAEFVLYYTYERVQAEPSGGGTSTVTVTEYAQVDTNKGYLTGWTTNEASATTLTSNRNGEITVMGLDAGTYYLKETKAPDGYTLLSDPVEITVGNTGTVTYKVDGTDVNASDTNYQVQVENKPGYELPLTGGSGTLPFAMVGLLLTGGAAYLLYITMRRRKGERQF